MFGAARLAEAARLTGDNMIRRPTAVVTLAGIFLAGFALSAGAVVTKSGTFSLENTGVRFGNGSFKFFQYETWDFFYEGYLNDTAADGHDVFVHGKVEGYGYGTRLYYQGQKSQYLGSSAVNKVGTARVQACVDRGTLLPDVCDDRGFTNS